VACDRVVRPEVEPDPDRRRVCRPRGDPLLDVLARRIDDPDDAEAAGVEVKGLEREAVVEAVDRGVTSTAPRTPCSSIASRICCGRAERPA
jgi:hypothetical protein